jgi:hypothetical protein
VQAHFNELNKQSRPSAGATGAKNESEFLVNPSIKNINN